MFGTGDLTGAESHLRRAGARTDETGTIEWIRGIASGALSGLYLWRGYGEEKRAGASILSGPTLCSYLATAQYALGHWDDAAITVHQALSVQPITNSHNIARSCNSPQRWYPQDVETGRPQTGTWRKPRNRHTK